MDVLFITKEELFHMESEYFISKTVRLVGTMQ